MGGPDGDLEVGENGKCGREDMRGGQWGKGSCIYNINNENLEGQQIRGASSVLRAGKNLGLKKGFLSFGFLRLLKDFKGFRF